jgi:hypothetical protein
MKQNDIPDQARCLHSVFTIYTLTLVAAEDRHLKAFAICGLFGRCA